MIYFNSETMKSKMFLMAAMAALALTSQADEGRLLRFPGTNGREVAFSYAGDIYNIAQGL